MMEEEESKESSLAEFTQSLLLKKLSQMTGVGEMVWLILFWLDHIFLICVDRVCVSLLQQRLVFTSCWHCDPTLVGFGKQV